MTAPAPDHTSPSPHRRAWASRLADWPFPLLLMAVTLWCGNAIVGRAVSGHVPPVGLAFWRWTLAGLIMLAFTWPHVRRDWPMVRAHWRPILLLSFLGITIFNTFLYIGLQDTQAINALLIQTALPVIILMWGVVVFGERVRPLQALGLLVSLAGAATVISRGDPSVLLSLHWNRGDLWVLAAVAAHGAYTAFLRLSPAISPWAFLTVTFLAGALMLSPLYAYEVLVQGRSLPLDLSTLGAIGYVTLLPSILAYACYNRGVALVGASTAGQILYLMPLVGGLMSVFILGETLLWAHGAGLVLILSGLWLAARRPKTPPEPLSSPGSGGPPS